MKEPGSDRSWRWGSEPAPAEPAPTPADPRSGGHGFRDAVVVWLVAAPFVYVFFVARFVPPRFGWIATWLISGFASLAAFGCALDALSKDGRERRNNSIAAVISLLVAVLVWTPVGQVITSIVTHFW